MERMHQQGQLGKTEWNVLDASDSVNSDDSEEEKSGDDGEIRLCGLKGCISEAGGMCI